MEPNSELLRLRPVANPDSKVHRLGFPLDHPYLERCWTSVLGSSAVLMIRRAAALFRESPAPVVPLDELAGSLGLGASVGAGSRIRKTVDRVVQMRFGSWAAPGELVVFTEMRPLSERLLEHAPALVRRDHARLLDAHLTHLASAPTGSPDLLARLDRLTHPAPTCEAVPLAR